MLPIDQNKRRKIFIAIGIILGLTEAFLFDVLLTTFHLYNTVFVLMLGGQGFGFGFLNAAPLLRWRRLL